ncbi:MAG: Wzt carbohydrate-binding domain-containing protein, partial [Pseudomonadota bacterium]|nr:Wzt carbohydrate-binding domain-containing protein [Pseudomonadota bacterium]
LGQHLVGDNSYLAYAAAPVTTTAGQELEASFEFRMPLLPKGQYSFDIALANGTQLEHQQAQWLHDAIVLESHSTSVSTGLVGVVMRRISLSATDEYANFLIETPLPPRTP